jgi:hypothetical protein
VFDVKPASGVECDVTSAGSRVVVDPYAVVVPYWTCDDAVWSVVQMTVADVSVIVMALTPEITGNATVVNVASADAPVCPSPFADSAR